MDNPTIEQLTAGLKAGQIAVIPTDTIYGIVARAEDEEAVKKLASIRGRETGKPFIILISDLSDLEKFGIKLLPEQLTILDQLWPGPFSVGFTSPAGFDYLKNGTDQLTFRLPHKDNLMALLKQTGPLVAPSANEPGGGPTLDIETAKGSFGNRVDFYIDEGPLHGQPSTVITLKGTQIEIKRQGVGNVPAHLLNPLIDYSDFEKVKLKIGKILTAERVEKSDKLLKLQIDLEESSSRQIIAGIGLAYTPESLIGKQVAIVANLKPRKLMGLESQGMILAASNDGGPVVLNPEQPVENGCDIH